MARSTTTPKGRVLSPEEELVLNALANNRVLQQAYLGALDSGHPEEADRLLRTNREFPTTGVFGPEHSMTASGQMALMSGAGRRAAVQAGDSGAKGGGGESPGQLRQDIGEAARMRAQADQTTANARMLTAQANAEKAPSTRFGLMGTILNRMREPVITKEQAKDPITVDFMQPGQEMRRRLAASSTDTPTGRAGSTTDMANGDVRVQYNATNTVAKPNPLAGAADAMEKLVLMGGAGQGGSGNRAPVLGQDTAKAITGLRSQVSKAKQLVDYMRQKGEAPKDTNGNPLFAGTLEDAEDAYRNEYSNAKVLMDKFYTPNYGADIGIVEDLAPPVSLNEKVGSAMQAVPGALAQFFGGGQQAPTGAGAPDATASLPALPSSPVVTPTAAGVAAPGADPVRESQIQRVMAAKGVDRATAEKMLAELEQKKLASQAAVSSGEAGAQGGGGAMGRPDSIQFQHLR